VGITLEWVRMPNGIYFRTICQNGVPLPEPTRYLLRYVHPGLRSTQTVQSYGQWLLPFFKWLDQQGLALIDITRMDLDRFRNDLTLPNFSAQSLLRKGTNSANLTVYYALTITIRFLQWAMGPDDTQPLLRRGHGYPMPRRRVAISTLLGEDINFLSQLLPRKKRILPDFLTQSQLDICRTWIMETYEFDPLLQLRNRAIFEVMWDGALRRGALLGLRTTNIHWIERSILVSFNEQDYRDAWFCKRSNYRYAKTGEYMVIVADQTIQWLDRYRQEAKPIEALRLGHGIFFCEHAVNGKDHGQPLSLETLLYFFELMSKPVNEGGTGFRVTPHMLRHTWAAMAEEDGLPPKAKQYQLGHAHLSTSEIYSHLSPEKIREDLKHWRQSHPERYGVTKQ
jgi:site-specific recombinase XerD